MLNNRVYRYLTNFLLGKHTHLESSMRGRLYQKELIIYTDKPKEVKQEGIVICRSNFFSLDCYGLPHSEPKLPLAEWRGIPILFGEGREEWINEGKTLVIYADLVASAFYLLSRYEEMLFRHVRDQYGRFPAERSLPVRAGFIHRPIIDEYTEVLRQIICEYKFDKLFGIKFDERKRTFSKINLSHDLIEPYRYNGFRSLYKAFKDVRNPLKALSLSFFNDEDDDYNTFSDLLRMNQELIDKLPDEHIRTQFFVKTKSPNLLDRPNYSLRSAYMTKIFHLGESYKVKFGLSCSYHASLNPNFTLEQKEILDKHFNQNTTFARYHLLAQREPEDLKALFEFGIKHDYSMAYAEVAGFRLGTCRTIQYINPNTRRLWELTIHPLTVMDRTLSAEDCMHLSFDDALEYTHSLIRQVARHGGELNLLWHNDLLSTKVHPWQSKLYASVLSLIKDLCPQSRGETNADE